MSQIKMQSAELERFARAGATQVIVEERRRHLAMDKRFPGILADAIRTLRKAAPARVAAEAEPEEPKRRTLSAAARRRISLAQKARWRKQKRAAAAKAS